jgi:stage V sporulation protein AD
LHTQTKRLGKQTIAFTEPPIILSRACVVGPKEGEGPLKGSFDKVIADNYYNEKTWEKAEQKMLQEAMEIALGKANLQPDDMDFLLAGDLLNQLISANYTARNLGIPFLGLYGACSTMVESLVVGSILIDGGYAEKVLAGASSHYDTAERQFRFPTELGTQRPLSAQWTVTGAGSIILSKAGLGPRITHATVGKVVDMGISDSNDMGSAMAPAAADTMMKHFEDTNRGPQDYDLIITGDLASIGKALTQQLVTKANYNLNKNYTDCGMLIYDPIQDTHAGGSGCGCSAVVLCGKILKDMDEGKFKRILVIGTGALLSPTSILQGESIPGIGHAVVIET